MKKVIAAISILMVLVMMTACGPKEVEISDDSVPGRMVTKIEIDIHPRDPDFVRCYTNIDQMSSILRMLRDMDTHDTPEEDPVLGDGQSYYTVTATYANGTSQVYYLLGHQFMRCGEGSWCVVESGKIMELIQFIRSNPEDAPATEATEETAAETEPESTEAPTGESTEESTDPTTASE